MRCRKLHIKLFKVIFQIENLGNFRKPLLIGSSVKMASNRPGSIEQEQDRLEDFGRSLLSMENLDRSSPELWPEKIPGMTEFISSFQTTPQSTTKPPYSKELSQEDQNYMHQLASLSTSGLIGKVKELHDIAYQLGVEESKELTRGKYLNLFNRSKKTK